MRLTNIQLIHAAHHAARYLPKASGELVRELATRLDVALVAQREATKQRDALAAENAGLKQFPDQIVNFIGKLGTSEIGSSTREAIETGAKRIKTPATDAHQAELRAQGVEMFAREIHADISEADAIEFAAQLRQDANTTELVAAGILVSINGEG
ncbi:hypothetical protein [Leclercia adecarboxylata]|uniref:hypothetical protein n=1 Tax=Leclercia adecarboxylata TaxID=83655 RepID=UPI00111B0349|nr:hypothetical protein [Leclercia adecarboxylata]QCZ26183.1 hypothetical protein FHN83_05780 [Leclercia adecarboxylata]